MAAVHAVRQGVLPREIDLSVLQPILKERGILADRYRDLFKPIFLLFRVEALRVERIHQIVEEHNRLFEAICIKDVALAKELLRNHNRNARKNLFSLIFDDNQKDKKIQ